MSLPLKDNIYVEYMLFKQDSLGLSANKVSHGRFMVSWNTTFLPKYFHSFLMQEFWKSAINLSFMMAFWGKTKTGQKECCGCQVGPIVCPIWNQ